VPALRQAAPASYAAKFDFPYNNRATNGVEDAKRSEIALRGAAGKRLTYRRIGEVTQH
jgi:hypothetical protein